MKDRIVFHSYLPALALFLMLLSGCTQPSEVAVSGKFIDSRDNREYKWVTIGTQTWMAENLAYLPSVNPPGEGSDSVSCYYVYRFFDTDVEKAKSTSLYKAYGVFYNWPAVLNGADSSHTVPSGIQGICPDDWHLPSDEEWEILIQYLGGQYMAGEKMKSVKGWDSYGDASGNGSNTSGFNALPAGSRNNDGMFYTAGFDALFWSSTGFGDYCAWNRDLGYSHNGVYRYYYNRQYGFSVRCVRDEQSTEF